MKYLFSIMFLFISIFSFGQNERWDKDNCIYSNYEYGFSWTLPNEVPWKIITGTEKHTVFKAFQPDTYINVFVNANKIEGKNKSKYDISDIYNYIIEKSDSIDKVVEINTGIKTISHKFKKCLFCGQNAYKSYQHTMLKDDRYDDPIEFISTSYYYIYKGISYAVTIKMYKNVYDYEGANDFINEIFRGYTIVNKY